MLVGVLRSIAERPTALTIPAFYWKLLAAAGLRPVLDTCVRCGESGAQVNLVAFDTNEGGTVCRACRSGVGVSHGALTVMGEILGGRLREALEREESPLTHEVAALATRSFEHHVERRLRAVAMFEVHGT
jgi:DNA repair protein RecO (recombination protein O)